MPVQREIEVAASPQDVWDALIDEERRVGWLGEEGREIDVEQVQEPSRLVWWWADSTDVFTRVEVLIVAAPIGARVIVTETVPSFPLPALAACLAKVVA